MSNETLCIIILIISCIVALSCLLWQIKKEGLRVTCIKLITLAEKNYIKGANKEKLKAVVDGLLTYIPMPFRLLLTYNNIESFVQKVFDDVKIALDYKGE